MLQRLLFMALGAASIFYIIVKISLSYWKQRGILHEKPKFIWGNLKGVGSKRHLATVLMNIYEKYKGRAPFIGFYAYLQPMVLVLDLELVEHILRKDADYFLERGLYCNEQGEPLTANMLQLDGYEWKSLRKQMEHTVFGAEKMSKLLPALLNVSTTFQRALSEKQMVHAIFDINELVDCFNVDVLSCVVFGFAGSDSLSYPSTEFRLMTHAYFDNFSLLKAYFAFSYPCLARMLQYRSHNEVSSAYFMKLIDNKITERSWDRTERPVDFLQLFADMNHALYPAERLNNQQIAAQAFSFILTDLQACNSTLSLCLYELALQPELQLKARDEIKHVLALHKHEVNMETLNDMKFIKRILHETLRKHTPYPFLLRKTIKDYEVPNSVFMLQKENHLIIPISAIHHDPKIYPSPNKFDPDRFLPAAVQERHDMAWLPFGVGPRNCLAMHFAEMQMLVGLISLLKDFNYSVCVETSMPLQYDNRKLTISSHPEIKLLVERA